MSQFLKQSTACTIMFGVFVDKTDGVTLETGAGIITSIDHATTGIFLSKNGAAAAIRHQGVTASVLDAYGMFKVTLDTTDTNTVGTLDVLMAEAATFLPVHKSFMVLPANVYDSLMGTDLLDVNAAQWLGTAILAPGVAGTPDVNAKLIGGTAQTGVDVGAKVNNLPSDPADQSAVEAAITAAHATTNGKIDAVDDYVDTEVGAIKGVADKIDTALVLDGAVYQFTANALELAPTGGSAPTVGQIADGVWDESLTAHKTVDSAGELLQLLGSKWEITANQLKLYALDGTLLRTFNLTQDGSATEYNPDKRELA